MQTRFIFIQHESLSINSLLLFTCCELEKRSFLLKLSWIGTIHLVFRDINSFRMLSLTTSEFQGFCLHCRRSSPRTRQSANGPIPAIQRKWTKVAPFGPVADSPVCVTERWKRPFRCLLNKHATDLEVMSNGRCWSIARPYFDRSGNHVAVRHACTEWVPRSFGDPFMTRWVASIFLEDTVA